MNLQQAFDVTRGDVIAFIGAGGKTSALIALGHELAEAGWRVLATTTTVISDDQLRLMPHALTYRSQPRIISEALTEHGFVFLYDTIQRGQVYGPAMEWTREILDHVDSDVLLIEADGASGLPLKAPYQNEPSIPPETTLVIPIASLSALGQPLDDEHVYNSQAMIERYGFYPGSDIRVPWIAQVLRDEELGLRGIPETARVIAFLNQTPAEGHLRERARRIAQMALKSPRLNGVALGSVRSSDPICEVQRPIAAVVLAGGQGSRMGRPKQLLPWTHKRTILEHIIEQLSRAHIDHIYVVTGYYAERVKALSEAMGATAVHNRAHISGEMLSSLQVGLKSLPPQITAAMVVLGDQPRIQPRVVQQITQAYAESANSGQLIAPSYLMRRGHPILIGRRHWSAVIAQKESLREVLNENADEIAYVTVETDSVLRDVDTPDDYENERRRAGLRKLDIRSRRKPDAF